MAQDLADISVSFYPIRIRRNIPLILIKERLARENSERRQFEREQMNVVNVQTAVLQRMLENIQGFLYRRRSPLCRRVEFDEEENDNEGNMFTDTLSRRSSGRRGQKRYRSASFCK